MSSSSSIPSRNDQEQAEPSFSAFSEIDNLVSKPVIGSDGALSWQNWRNEAKGINKSTASLSVAPNLPMKQIDRKNTGFQNFDQERENEMAVRKTMGDVAVGEGYTVFKRKEHEDKLARNESNTTNIQLQKRTRPPDAIYFMQAKTFEGWKHDYIFTTKDGRGTGYFWDGWDTARGVLETQPKSSKEGDADSNKTRTKKKKRKKGYDPHDASSLFQPDESNHPMTQVAEAIARAAQAASSKSSAECNNASHPARQKQVDVSLDEAGWSSAVDSGTQKVYYFNKLTKETRWDHPLGGVLPPGWNSVKDKESG
eukprot:CAMPEP_0194386128 /NCGR_PEP_ID=MMETSP0174-20130528/84642_1 /TAXON_ID=216777 /ORGANISM="Proboscia alata, Strain PI-D3" /LENGTH=310 /DNA_ID=CAMNT_0039174989 /DNA_START=28 /DNA_END=956 /DNA_ORIENTATION=-